MTDKPNPYVGRPIKWLIPEWLSVDVHYEELCNQMDELQKQRNALYERKSQLADAIKKTAKENQVFILKDGRVVVINAYGIALSPITELVATVRKDKPTGG